MSNSRDKILNAVANNQPLTVALPDISFLKEEGVNLIETFINTLTNIGGEVIRFKEAAEMPSYFLQKINLASRRVTTLPSFKEVAELINTSTVAPHTFKDIDYAIIGSNIAVAENGAIWITEDMIRQRVLPFICQHLIVVLNARDIVGNMHIAYDKIGNDKYGFGTFIAGPSKTADIEQSLVLGAHGSRTMTIFLIME